MKAKKDKNYSMNRLTFQLRKHFTILPYHYMKRAEYVFEPVLDLYARKFRKMALDSSILEKNRLVIPANRTRGIDDTLLKLKKNHETAGVIFARGNLPEVNFVLDNRQGFSLHRIKHHLTQHYYVRIPETQELIRVLIDKIEIIDSFSFYLRLFFIFCLVFRRKLGSLDSF